MMMMMTRLCVDGVAVGERVGVPGGLGSGKPIFLHVAKTENATTRNCTLKTKCGVQLKRRSTYRQKLHV